MMYRAYWAIPRTMKNVDGEQVNTVFGMASMLLTILQKEQPDAMVICFDEGEETVRHQEHDGYKEGRAETPDDFYSQIPRVMQLLSAFGFPTVSNPRYEADDLIASYAKEGEKRGMRVTIVSGDRDLFQMATSTIRIAIPHKGYQATEYLGPDEVLAKYGIRPDQVASYKGLSGDASDNLPGVKGIGPKTAALLLAEYGTLQAIYENLPAIRPTWREKLEQDREQAFFCEKLATLHIDLPLPCPMEDVHLGRLPTDAIRAFFSELRFTLLRKRLDALLDTEYGKNHFDASAEPSSQKSADLETEEQMSLF